MARRAKLLLALCITTAASVVFATTLVSAVWSAPVDEVAAPALEAVNGKPNPADVPTRLRIPALQIDARVRQVGVTAAGDMATPGSFADVGWYKYGTVPGYKGSAVINGHVDNALSLPGVFKRLGEAQPGDEILIERSQGLEPLRFVVTQVVSYDKDEVPLEALFARQDRARLNLITCGGTWLKDEETYDTRIVVYAELRSV